MIGTRLTLCVIAVLALVPAADAGPIFGRKPKLDAARVKQLNETLRTDPNEKKRLAAVTELRDGDPRVVPELIPALITTLQRDASASVRAAAADAIGRFKLIFPLAGLALENAAESDSSAEVRGAAQQALWEYHLGGYRSARGADGIAGQTAEPPLARLPAPRPTVVTPPPVQVVPIPPVPSNPPLPQISPPRPVLSIPVPPTVPPPAPPQVNDMDRGGIRTLLTAAPPLLLNLTEEPPLARRVAAAPPPPPLPAVVPAPRFSLPVAADLPPISLPPDVEFPSNAAGPPATAPLPGLPVIPAPPLPKVPALPPLPVPPVPDMS